MQLRKETCIGCECELQYTKSIPTKQMGVMMHMGERFCTGGKRARKFKRSDPKIYVPDWCPKRKKPCELRVYCFKNKNEWRLHEMLCHDLGMDHSMSCTPTLHRRNLPRSATMRLTPKRSMRPFTDTMW